MHRPVLIRARGRASHITTTIPCCITGSHEAVVIAGKDREGRPLQTVMSTESGLVFTDPRPTPEDVRHFYANEYRQQYKKVYTPTPKHVLRAGRLAVQRLKAISPYLRKRARILDAGSGGGEFVYLGRQRGYQTQGIEPNRGYAQHAVQQYGIDVFNGFYQDASYADDSFDCITLFHVLEHLEDPVASLRVLSAMLRPGGHFVVEVPNVTSTATAPSHKWHLGHLYNFNSATLAATGMKAGLTPLSLQHSRDGGVLFAVFRKGTPPTEQHVRDTLAGNFDTTYRLLSQHTPTSHYLRFWTPLARLLARAKRSVNERRTTKRYSAAKPKQILDDLIRATTPPPPPSSCDEAQRLPNILLSTHP